MFGVVRVPWFEVTDFEILSLYNRWLTAWRRGNTNLVSFSSDDTLKLKFVYSFDKNGQKTQGFFEVTITYVFVVHMLHCFFLK